MTDRNSTSSSTSTSTPQPDALESVREELDRMTDAEVLLPRIDVAKGALVAIGSMPEIETHRATIVSVFGDEGARSLDRVVPLARALTLAHAEHVSIAERDIEPMAKEVMAVRTRLLTAANALIARRVVDDKTLEGLVGGQSYQAAVMDTLALVRWFTRNMAAIASHTKVSAAELAEAQVLATAFGDAYSMRDQARSGSSPSAKTRARAFTLFFRTYERVRQMLTYLRWHEGDVERIAPSLFAGRARQGDAEPELAPPPTEPVRPGMPGADPFVRT